MAKLFASEAAVEATVIAAIQTWRLRVLADYPVELIYRDVRAGDFMRARPMCKS